MGGAAYPDNIMRLAQLADVVIDMRMRPSRSSAQARAVAPSPPAIAAASDPVSLSVRRIRLDEE